MAALFKDALLLAVFASATALIAYSRVDAAVVKRDLRKILTLEPGSLEVRALAGEAKSLKLTVRAAKPAQLEPPLSFVDLQPKDVGAGAGEVSLVVKPLRAGVFSSSGISARVRCKLSLWEVAGVLSFNLTVKVYPKVCRALVEGASLLLSRGASEWFGETPTQRVGGGTEYAWSRPYVRGDDLRKLDWKAYARLGKPMVKDFFQEGGAGSWVVCDCRCVGDVSRDQLLTTMLNLLISAANLNAMTGLLLHDGRDIIALVEPSPPNLALKAAMGYAMRELKVELEELPELIPPATRQDVLKMLAKVSEEPARRFMAAKLKILAERLTRPYATLLEAMKGAEGKLNIIWVTALAAPLEPVLEVLDAARSSGHDSRLVLAAKPWMDLRNLEDAYRAYKAYEQGAEILRGRGAAVYTAEELEKLASG